MATEFKVRRGTTAEHAAFTGAEGEITLDTNKDTLVVHDNYQGGGYPMLREDLNNLADNSVGISKIETGTQGDILYYNASGQLAKLSAATSGQVLKTSGSGGNPYWDYGGRVQQIVNRVYTGSGTFTINTSDTRWPGTEKAITTIADNSKIMVWVRAFGEWGDTWNSICSIRRDGTRINVPGTNSSQGSHMFSQTYNEPNNDSTPEVISFFGLDSPNVSSGTTLLYDMSIVDDSTRTGVYYNRAVNGDEYGSTEIVLMEIA